MNLYNEYNVGDRLGSYRGKDIYWKEQPISKKGVWSAINDNGRFTLVDDNNFIVGVLYYDGSIDTMEKRFKYGKKEKEKKEVVKDEVVYPSQEIVDSYLQWVSDTWWKMLDEDMKKEVVIE